MRLNINEKRLSEIKDFIETLPILNENEGFFFILFLRKKWVKLYYPDDVDKFPNSGEILFTKFVLDYEDFAKGDDFEYFVRKLINNLSIIDDVFGKVKIIKGKKYYTNELFEKYRNAISLSFVYEPRDILKGTMRLVSDYVKKFMYGNYSTIEILKFKHKWDSYIHSSNRKNDTKYVLVDIDFKYEDRKRFEEMNTERLKEVFEKIEEYLNSLKISFNLRYAVSTPSKGIHLILLVDENIGKKVFKDFEKFKTGIKKMVEDNFNLEVKEIELKRNPVQTHAPFSFINPNIVRLDG